jgi:hypothetical protein
MDVLRLRGLPNIDRSALSQKYLVVFFLLSTNRSSKLHCLQKNVRPVTVKLLEAKLAYLCFIFVCLRLLVEMHIFAVLDMA